MPQNKDIIVIGASIGGIEALKGILSGLPRELPASVFIVQHIGPYGHGILPEILERAGRLPASNARDWEKFKPGHIYVAPPDHHLLIERTGHTRITHGPKENRTRPAVDPLFRSAAYAFGLRVIGVVLTGWLDDGTAGLWAIKDRSGIAIVQDPADAIAASMPRSALQNVEIDHCVPLKEIAPLLVRLASEPADEKGVKPVSRQMQTEVKIAAEDKAIEEEIQRWGEPSIFACPECHGVLLQLKDGGNVRFRCHTGHAYSIESLLAEFTEKTEDTLWSAIRSIQETVLLLRRMAEQLAGHQHNAAAEALLKKAAEAEQRSYLVRQAVLNHERLGDGKP